MEVKFYLLNALIQAINIQFAECDDKSLKAVFVIHRHGNRCPVKTYPNDPYKNESFWPDGFGELTNDGKKRMYNLGGYLRKRYDNLNKFFTDNPREVQVRSSAAERCLDSVSLLLAGAYPPKNRWIWNEHLHWQPFPIQTEPRIMDGMLYPGSNCPKASVEQLRVRNSPQVELYSRKYKALFEYLETNSGKNITSIWDAERLGDVLKIEKEVGLELPAWANESVMKDLSSITSMTFYFDYSTKLLQRLRAGLLLKDIRSRMLDISRGLYKMPTMYSDVDDSVVRKRLFIYSSHDTLISALLSSLNVYNMHFPPYSASVILELYKGNGTEHFVSAYYLNVTESEMPNRLQFPGCQSKDLCPLKEFIKFTQSNVPDNWRKECGLEISITTTSTGLVTYLLIVSFVTTLLLLFIATGFIYLNRRKQNIVYSMLPFTDSSVNCDS